MKKTDRQTDGWKDRQTDGQTDTQTDRDRQRETHRQRGTDGQQERKMERDRLGVWMTYEFSLKDVKRPFVHYALVTPLKVKHVFYHTVTKDWIGANYLVTP